MRAFWALALFCIGSAAGFQSGNEYVYSYEGKIQIKNPEQPLHSNGFAFRCKLTAQPRQDRTVFGISDVEVDIFDGDRVRLEKHVFHYQRHQGFSEHVERPFAGTFEEGKIEHAELGKNEPLWSWNFKKGVLSLFQLDLVRSRTTNLSGNEFRVNEDGIYGHCGTRYMVSEDEGHLEVTKVKNLEDCSGQHYRLYGRVKGYRCVSCKAQQTLPVTATSETTYGLTGTREDYVIQNAFGASDQLYAEYADGKAFHVQINQTLHLLEQHDVATELQLPEVEVHNELAHSFAKWEDAMTYDDLQHPNHYVQSFGLTAKIDQFIEDFKTLAKLEYSEQDYKGLDQKQSGGLQFLLLFYDMITFGYSDISEIYNQHVLNAPPEAKDSRRNLFLDLLAAAGNNPHVAFGLQLIKAGQVKEKEGSRYLTRVTTNLKESSVAVIKDMASTCDCEFVKAHPHLRSSCVLALSALVGGDRCIRGGSLAEQDSGLCAPTIVADFFNYSFTPEDVKNKPEIIILAYLRAAGNLATTAAVHYADRFIDPNRQQPTHRRAAAFWSLKKAAATHPELVLAASLPVYRNTSEPLVLRLAAFTTILMSNPDLSMLRYIARTIIDEPSDQLASFVTSSFRGFLNSEFPCDAELAQKLRYVVRLWDNVRRFSKPLDVTKSGLQVVGMYDRKYDIGARTVFSMIRSEDSLFPNSIFWNITHYYTGRAIDTMAVGLEGWGLDRLLNLLVGPTTASQANLWNVFGRRRSARDVSAAERQQIEEALPITDREYEDLLGRMTITLNGNVVLLYQLDQSALESLKPQATSKGPDDPETGSQMPFKSFYLAEDVIFSVPTELGFPIYFNVKQAQLMYSNRQSANFGWADGKLNLGYKSHLLYDIRSYHTLGLALTFNKTSVGCQYDAWFALSLPLQLEGSYDPTTSKLSLTHPLSLPVDVLHYHFLPHSFVVPFNRADMTPTQLANPGKFLYNDEEVAPFDRTYKSDFLGLRLNVKGFALKKDFNRTLHNLWHSEDWNKTLFYLMFNPEWRPRSLRVQLLPTEADAGKSLHLDVSYLFLKPGETKMGRTASWAFPPAKEGQDPFTHLLNFNFKVEGENTVRERSTELSYSYSEDLLRHDVRLVRTAEHANESLCFDASATFPKPDFSKLLEPAAFHKGKRIVALAKLGGTCDGKPMVTLSGKYSHTDEDAQEIEANLAGAPRNLNRMEPHLLRGIYDQCVRDREHGVKFSHHCHKYLYFTSRLGKLSLDVHYENLTLLRKGVPEHYNQYHQHRKDQAGFLDILLQHMTGDSGQFHVVSQVPGFQTRPRADVIITTPDGHKFHHQDVPLETHLLEPKVFTALGYSNLADYSSYYRHKYCDVQGKSAMTFDGLIVDLPDTNCYKVVARDCSQNRRFVILEKTVNNAAFPKALKMFIQTTKIEIFATADKDTPTVSVDGAPVTLSGSSSWHIHTIKDVPLFKVKVTDKYYEILSESFGIYIIFNGDMLAVQVAPFYRGKLCGICGNYNYDRIHELVGPNLHLYNDTLKFAKSYVVPSSDCTVS